MYCPKCGNLLVAGSQYCTKCGAPVGNLMNANIQYGLPPNTRAFSDQKRDIAFFVSLLTSPLILILRIMMQQEQLYNSVDHGGWKNAQYHQMYVPDEMKVVLFVILLACIVVSILLMRTSENPDRRREAPTKALCWINAFIGFLLIMGTYNR